jgi:putative SOS response-associated peptidase YedK
VPGRFFLTEGFADVMVEPRRNISPGQEIWTITAQGPQRMRWGLIPSGRLNVRGRPVMETLINARAETVFDKSAFHDVGRAVVPASGWYEWTGKAGRKQPWRIRRKDGALIYFAAIYDVWHGPGGIKVPQVATITCAPSADVRDIHHRMGVILEDDRIADWFDVSDEMARQMLVPFPDGRLIVEKVDDVDWDMALLQK